MKIYILSGRSEKSRNASWQIVYEWEDIISEKTGVLIKNLTKSLRIWYSILNKLKLFSVANLSLKRDIYIYYCSVTTSSPTAYWNKHFIPVLIDFWLQDDDIEKFCKNIRRVPLLLVTSREVYNKLKDICPVPIEHWPLSLPDQYSFIRTTNYEKKYDFSFIGRPDPFFFFFLDEYCKRHPDFIYVQNHGDKGRRYYSDNKGRFIATDNGRESYWDMIRKTKITCYTTPGYDEAKKGANGYNQVTPRVFEMLCGGCHVIGHYPMSDDVLWYRLERIVPNVTNYVEFESVLERMLNESVDISRVKCFMESHYTSQRAVSLIDILKKHKILKKVTA